MSIKIPPAALEAGARLQFKNEYPETEMVWEDCNEYEQAEYRRQARAAFLAMLQAWPGAHGANRIEGILTPIILPLTQEASDD